MKVRLKTVTKTEASVILCKFLKSNPGAFYRFLYNHANQIGCLDKRLTRKNVEYLISNSVNKLSLSGFETIYSVNLHRLLSDTNCAFIWHDTPEGYGYWYKLHNQFENYIINLKKN